MYIYIYVICISLSLYLSLYISIYLSLSLSLYIYIYIYICLSLAQGQRKRWHEAVLLGTDTPQGDPKTRESRTTLTCAACDTCVCEQKHSFRASPCPAVRQQKLQSGPRFGLLKADFAHLSSYPEECFFSQTPVRGGDYMYIYIYIYIHTYLHTGNIGPRAMRHGVSSGLRFPSSAELSLAIIQCIVIIYIYI